MAIVNPDDITALLQIDPLFEQIHAQYGAPPNWSRPQGFVSLSKMILEQQVSLASAAAHFAKLNSYLENDFSPDKLLLLSDEELRTCQISRQKSTYLRALSQAVQEGSLDLENLAHLPETRIREQLTRIKGIGDWTTDIYLMFCLQARDIFPIGDIAVVNTIKALKGVQDKAAILDLAEQWRPYRSLAVYYLWHHYLETRNRKAVF